MVVGQCEIDGLVQTDQCLVLPHSAASGEHQQYEGQSNQPYVPAEHRVSSKSIHRTDLVTTNIRLLVATTTDRTLRLNQQAL